MQKTNRTLSRFTLIKSTLGYSRIFGLLFILMASGCSTTTCKIEDRPVVAPGAGGAGAIPGAATAPATAEGPDKSMTASKDLTSRVRVYKQDGSQQCGTNKKTDLSVMQKELGSIQVFSAESKHDGLMRIQMCGHPTGNCNVFEILSADLDKALKLGFKKWVRD